MSDQAQLQSNKFQKEILIEELLSLGHPKLSRQISHQIGLSIENYLLQHEISSPSTQLIHDLIDNQMKKIGFISLARHLPTMGVYTSQKAENFDHHSSSQENSSIPIEVLSILSQNNINLKKEEKSRKKSYQLENKLIKLPEEGRKFINQYCALQSDQGQLLEKPEQFFLRLAKYVAGFEKKYDPTIIDNDFENIFYDLLASKRFIPHSSILMNFDKSEKSIVTDYHIPLHHYDHTDTAKFLTQLIELEKIGARVNFDISNFYATSENKIGALEILSYLEKSLELFSPHSRNDIKHQAFISIHHPEIVPLLEYITTQEKPLQIIPLIGISHQFMKAIERDRYYPLIDPIQRQFVGQIDAYKIYRLLSHAICKTGNAQVVFLDRINELESIYRMPEKLIPTLDGSQFLKPYDSSGVNGHINLAEMVFDYDVDWEKLRLTIYQAVHFLDNIIDGIILPISECQEQLKLFRRIGLGIIGFHEMILKLGIEENERRIIEIFSQITNFIKNETNQATSLLAQRKSSIKGLNQTCLNPAKPRRNSHILADHFDPFINIIMGQKNSQNPNQKQSLEFKLKNILQTQFHSGVFHQISHETFRDESKLMQFIMQAYQHKLTSVSFMKLIFEQHQRKYSPKNQKKTWEQKELFQKEKISQINEENKDSYFLPEK